MGGEVLLITLNSPAPSARVLLSLLQFLPHSFLESSEHRPWGVCVSSLQPGRQDSYFGSRAEE